MGTIFQREEKPESLFDKIVKNEGACEMLQELFYEKLRRVENRMMNFIIEMQYVLQKHCWTHI